MTEQIPTARLLAGTMGSGKTTWAKHSPLGAYIGQDMLRQQHPEYKAYLQNGRGEEDYHIVQRIKPAIKGMMIELLERLTEARRNITIDNTLGNTTYYMGIVDMLIRQGYAIRVDYMPTTLPDCIANTEKRFRRGGFRIDPARTERKALDVARTIKVLSDMGIPIIRPHRIGRGRYILEK